MKVRSAILYGEIVVKDATGRPIFRDLMRRRGNASFIAFDLLWLNGKDFRRKPLLEHKRALARIIPRRRGPLIEVGIWLYGAGLKLFQLVEDHDLEGIVAKRKDGTYSASTPWLKVENPRYSQAEGRGELFKRSKVSRAGP